MTWRVGGRWCVSQLPREHINLPPSATAGKKTKRCATCAQACSSRQAINLGLCRAGAGQCLVAIMWRCVAVECNCAHNCPECNCDHNCPVTLWRPNLL